MKNLRNFVVLFTLVAGAVAANAQTSSSFRGTFQLTSDTRWGEAVLPAGHYELTLKTAESPWFVIHSDDWKVSAMAKWMTWSDAAPGGNYILITGSGDDRQVRSINLPWLKRSLVFKPLTRSERETLYASASQTVPVQMAKK